MLIVQLPLMKLNEIKCSYTYTYSRQFTISIKQKPNEAQLINRKKKMEIKNKFIKKTLSNLKR